MRTPLRKRPVVSAATAAVVLVGAAVVLGFMRSAHADGRTFTPDADTYVQQDSANTNFGTDRRIVVDGSPVRRLFLRFTVADLDGEVARATLRLRVSRGDAGSADGGTVHAVADTGWTETGTTWSNQPAADGPALGRLGRVSRDDWAEVDVTAAVTGNGTVSFVLTSDNQDGAYYDARESGDDAPQLVVSDAGPELAASPAGGPAEPGEPGQAVQPGPAVRSSTGGGAPARPGGPTVAADDPVLVGAGDIADSGSGDSRTAKLLDGIPGTVFTLGDNAYPGGSANDYKDYYEPTWGAFRNRTRPVPGNHEYMSRDAEPYYEYFGSRAGDPDEGFYSYDLGNWHIVALNSNIDMGSGSTQEKWLRADLSASDKPCTLAYWHHPLFTSSANHAPESKTRPLYKALYDNGADVVLWGHNHVYERFAPMNPDGRRDDAKGIRTWVAGMGGAGLYEFGTIQANSEVRDNTARGVLKFTLHADGYTWEFVGEPGASFKDKDSARCH